MLGLVLPGEPVGELLPTRAAHMVTALVTSRICRFRTGSGMDFTDFTPQLRHNLLSSFSVRLARLQNILWIRSSLSVNARVAALLLMASRFMEVRSVEDCAPVLNFRLPRPDAADLLATTVESFCRALYCLEAEGLIAVRDSHRFVLRDIAGLERLAALDSAYLDALFAHRCHHAPGPRRRPAGFARMKGVPHHRIGVPPQRSPYGTDRVR